MMKSQKYFVGLNVLVLEKDERLEAIFILDLALWKKQFVSGWNNDRTKRIGLDIQECLHQCGANVVHFRQYCTYGHGLWKTKLISRKRWQTSFHQVWRVLLSSRWLFPFPRFFPQVYPSFKNTCCGLQKHPFDSILRSRSTCFGIQQETPLPLHQSMVCFLARPEPR